MMNKNKEITDSQLVTYCLDEIDNGIGGYDDESDVSLPLDYYHGRLPGISKRVAKDPNSSRFVSMDVMDGVEATVAEIMPTFTSDEIAFYEAESESDEESVRAESELVNYLFFEEYDGYTLLQTALRDSLLHGNCAAKAYWDERVHVEYETILNVPEFALPTVLQPTKNNQKVEIVEQIIDSEAQVQQSPTGELVSSGAIYTIKIKRITKSGRPVIYGVKPEDLTVCGDHDSPYLHNARFVAHEKIETASSLIEQGFDPKIVENLKEYHGGSESLGRSKDLDNESYSSSHESTKLIQVFECYPLIDYDCDGIAERRKIVISDTTLLSNEEFSTVPLVGGVTTITPHEYKGLSLFDRLKEIQDSKTPVIRSIIDGTRLAANPRTGVLTGEVNLDDMLTSRTGGIVRANRVDAVFNLPSAEIPQSAFSMIGFMDGIRRERGGGAIDTASQAQKISGDTAHGIERTMSVMEQGNALLARTLGETLIRGIFIQMHDLIRENYKGSLNAKIGGKWVRSSPEDWKKRSRVSIQIGSSHAERARQARVLMNVIELQKELFANSSVMFNEEKSYTAIVDAIKLSGIKSPERYFDDPSSNEGKQKSQAKGIKGKEEQQKQDLMQQEMAKAQKMMSEGELMKGQASLLAQSVKQENDHLKRQLDEAKAIADAADKADKTQFNYDKLSTDVALKLTEMEVNAGKDLSQQNEDNLL